jgi:hypothetical protein
MSPALRSTAKRHLSRKTRRMILPFEHVSQPDATGDSSSEIDVHFHSDIGLEPRRSRVANTPVAELPNDSSSIKKSWA